MCSWRSKATPAARAASISCSSARRSTMVRPVSGWMGSGISRSASSSGSSARMRLAARRAVERESVPDFRDHAQRALRDVLVGEQRLVAVEHDELHRLVQLEREPPEEGRRLVAQLAAPRSGDADEAGADMQLAGGRQAHEPLLAQRPDDAVAGRARQPHAVGQRDGREALGRDRELAQQQRRAREHLHTFASLSHLASRPPSPAGGQKPRSASPSTCTRYAARRLREASAASGGQSKNPLPLLNPRSPAPTFSRSSGDGSPDASRCGRM